MHKPLDTEYDPFYKTYIDLIEDGDILMTLARQADYCAHNFETFADRGDHRYAENKWTVKQLLQHIIDVERILSYRIVRISRRDKTLMSGFDENAYADATPVDHRTVEDLIADFMSVRSATFALLKGLSPEQWTLSGTANGSEISVRALAYIIAGHCVHHIAILEDRYQ
jgi:DinB family protein